MSEKMWQDISVKDGYVLVERPPEYAVIPEKLPEELKRIAAACEAADCHKALLVGPRTTVSLSTGDIYDFGKRVGDSGLQIAIAETHDASEEDERFLENVARLRGGQIRFFRNADAAKKWLRVD